MNIVQRTVRLAAASAALLHAAAFAAPHDATVAMQSASSTVYAVKVTAQRAAMAQGETEAPIEVRADGKLLATLRGYSTGVATVVGKDATVAAALVTGDRHPGKRDDCGSDSLAFFFIHPDKHISDVQVFNDCKTRVDIKQDGDMVTLLEWPAGAPKDAVPVRTVVWKNGVRQ